MADEPSFRQISVLISEESSNREQRHSILPRPWQLFRQIDVPVEDLANSLSDCMESLREVVQKVPTTLGDYDVDELTFSISVNASGKVSLVAEVGAGVTSGIVIKIKRRPSNKQ